MYIAFKWLLALSFGMWGAMCCLDAFLTKNALSLLAAEDISGLNVIKPFEIFKNKTQYPVKSKFNAKSIMRLSGEQNISTYLHCLLFIAGALLISFYNRITDIITIINTDSIAASNFLTKLQDFSKITAKLISSVALTFYQKMMVNLINIGKKIMNVIFQFKLKMFQKQKMNLALLAKLKEIREDRKNLADLLAAAIQESKNVRTQYQLENLAKKRLTQHIEETQKVIKENRARYIRFQQLYLVTHQENTFLKSRLTKLTKEKEEAERNLVVLIHEVYKSRNHDLKAFCSRFIVNTKDNLLNANVGAEIEKFLLKSRGTVASPSEKCLLSKQDIHDSANLRRLKCSSCTEISEVNNKDLLVSTEPKLIGLPGEYVWTVKDKDGMIEKLYEYNYDTDLDNGETIRRIREYSVYYDKDCLLDFSNSTVVDDARSTEFENNCPRQRFLTGSEAFQKFIQNNNNLVSTAMLPEPPPPSDWFCKCFEF